MFYRETYIERGKDESSNDRNDRAIRVAARLVQDPVQMIFQFFSQKELGFDLIASIARSLIYYTIYQKGLRLVLNS